MVRVAPATNRMASLCSPDSTRVLPHQPRPTIAALIIADSFGSVAGLRLHRHHDATNRPEQRILTSAYVPQPFASSHAVNRDGCYGQVDCGDQADIERIDGQDEPDRQHDLDDASDIHPGCGRPEFRRDEEAERL